MRFSLKNRSLSLALMAIMGLGTAQMAQAQSKPAANKAVPAAASQFVDGIAAVVNDEVITLRQVDLEAAQVLVRPL